MTTSKISIREEQLVSLMHDFIRDCDADELAIFAGAMFGGECFFTDIEVAENGWDENCFYEFIPNEYYMGAFDFLIKKEEEKKNEKK